MSDIFLSYAREELARVRPLIQALEGHGWDVWWDEKIPAGQQYNQAIAIALREARCVLVVWSQASVESHWVQDEATRGRDRGILIPVRIDDIELPLGFGMFQTARLTQWRGDAADLEFVRIVQEVTRLIGPPAQLELETPAPERPQAADQRVDAPVDHPPVAAPRVDPQPVGRETPGRSGAVSRGAWLAVAVGVVAVGLYIFGPLKPFTVTPTETDKVVEEPAKPAQSPPKPETVKPDKNSIGIEFVRIQAGKFQMGSEVYDDEKPCIGFTSASRLTSPNTR